MSWGALAQAQNLLTDLNWVYPISEQDLPPTESPEDAIKVMWWNLDCATNVTSIKGKNYKSNLEKNILDVVDSKIRPDILVLGEYCPYYISNEFSKALNAKYKYKHHLVRNIPEFRTTSGKTNERNGILVLSDHPLSLVIEDTLYADEAQRSNNNKNRKYILFQIKTGQKSFFLNPLHLYNPWRNFYSDHGILATFFEIEGGTENPNAQQGRQLLSKNQSYVPKDSSLLIIGDFNSPKSFYAVDGYVYKLIRSHYDSLVLDSADTFISAGAFQTASIDHAFGQNLISLYGRVLPLAGSGHLPIYVIFQ